MGVESIDMLGVGTIAIEWFAVGIVLTVAGGLIKFRGWTFLLAGYDETSPIPDDVIADIAGNTVLRIGVATIAFGVVVSVADVPSYLPLVFEGVILVAVLRLLYRSTRTPQTIPLRRPTDPVKNGPTTVALERCCRDQQSTQLPPTR